MAINVLSDSFKGGNKLAKVSAQKGKDVADSPGNAAEVFAAIFSGTMNENVKTKGQNSSAAVQNTEEKQDDGDHLSRSPKLSDQSDGLMGYGYLTLPFMAQLMLQSDPAGKEANSGNVVSRGIGEALTTDVQSAENPTAAPAGLSSGLADSDVVILKELLQISKESSGATGMESLNSQGYNPAVTELDKYRQVIAGLLEQLSGEITTPQGTPLNLKGIETLSQNVDKLLPGEKLSSQFLSQGELQKLQIGDGTITESTLSKVVNFLKEFVQAEKGFADQVGNNEQSLDQQVESQPLEVKQSELKPVLEVVGQRVTKDNFAPFVLENMKLTLQPRDEALSQDAGQIKDAERPIGIHQSTEKIGKTEKLDFQAVTAEPKVESDEPKQSSAAALGTVANAQLSSVSSGKPVAVPVLEQITAAIHDQIMNRHHQELKELDIQLHPAELGKVNINLRWEDGLVHLQVRASEASTGHILQNQLTDLRQSLADQGVNCGMLQMGQGGSQQSNSQGNESRKIYNPNNNSSSAEEEFVPDPEPLPGNQDENSRINVMA